jgi:hypothetical protein
MAASGVSWARVAVGLVTGVAAATAHAQPRISAVGFITTGISSDGNTVVGISGSTYARWLRSGSPAFGTLPGDGYISGQQRGIIGAGDGSTFFAQITNSSGLNALPAVATVAGRWTAGAGWVPLPLLPNASQCGGATSTVNTVFGMSSDGRFAVGNSWVNGCQSRAWVCDLNTGVTTSLGNLSGVSNESSKAVCISDNGMIIAGTDGNPTGGNDRPVVWEWNGSVYVEQLLPTTGVASTEGGSVNCMTRDGSVLVGSNFGMLNHLATWTKLAGVWTPHDLGTIPGRPSWVPNFYAIDDAIAKAVSDDDGTIYGKMHYNFGGEHVYGAFLWTQHLGVTDLYDYLVAQNTDGIASFPSSGSTGFAVPSLSEISGCTADGQHAIGNGWILDLPGSGCIAPVVSLQPWQNSGVFGNLAVINSNAIGGVPLTYQWYRNGVPLVDGAAPWASHTTTITGATTSQLRLNNAAGIGCDDQGSFTCTFGNACGSVSTGSWAMRVANCCYANCDLSTTPPVLNVLDFTCFLQEFAAGSAYANCDGSTTAPVLNVVDFTCFLQKFAAGCP